jgi:hypothetical protein
MYTPLRQGICSPAIFALWLAAGCGGGVGAASPDGAELGRIPANHRPSDTQCLQPAPAGTCDAISGCADGGGAGICLTSPDPSRWTCLSDGDCGDAGISSRCSKQFGLAGCFCTSDRCVGDGDCPSGQTCACHGAPYMFGFGSACVPGNCRVDADCGARAYCSPTPALPCNMNGRDLYCQGVGYYCHTPKDQCIDDSDCQGAGFPGCLFDQSAGYWKCEIYSQPG